MSGKDEPDVNPTLSVFEELAGAVARLQGKVDSLVRQLEDVRAEAEANLWSLQGELEGITAGILVLEETIASAIATADRATAMPASPAAKAEPEAAFEQEARKIPATEQVEELGDKAKVEAKGAESEKRAPHAAEPTKVEAKEAEPEKDRPQAAEPNAADVEDSLETAEANATEIGKDELEKVEAKTAESEKPAAREAAPEQLEATEAEPEKPAAHEAEPVKVEGKEVEPVKAESEQAKSAAGRSTPDAGAVDSERADDTAAVMELIASATAVIDEADKSARALSDAEKPEPKVAEPKPAEVAATVDEAVDSRRDRDDAKVAAAVDKATDSRERDDAKVAAAVDKATDSRERDDAKAASDVAVAMLFDLALDTPATLPTAAVERVVARTGGETPSAVPRAGTEAERTGSAASFEAILEREFAEYFESSSVPSGVPRAAEVGDAPRTLVDDEWA